METIRFKSRLVRVGTQTLVGLIVIPAMVLWMFFAEDRLGQVIIVMLIVGLPLPYTLFGQWPPNGRPGVPFEVLGTHEKIESVWSEASPPLFFAIAILWVLRFFIHESGI